MATKLAILGGGGVRAPMLVGAALKRAEKIGIEEIALMDVNPEKLRVFGGLARQVAEADGSDVKVTLTDDAEAALTGASYAVTTVRVGGERGRVLDERIALRHGVLGQETTGPGGFAMALRNVPQITEYARLLERVSPGAWIFNFTNPAGLVVQALRDQGLNRTIGICDSANLAQTSVAARLGVEPNSLRPEVFGLNHLSWVRKVAQDGDDRLGPLLADPEFVKGTVQRFFDPELRSQLGMWANEYLYYYYYAEDAVSAILGDEETRGEEVEKLNKQLIEQLTPLLDKDPAEALSAYAAYDERRRSTYMHYADPNQADGQPLESDEDPEADDEGYAGVALDLMEALESDQKLYTGLNVPNAGAIPGMADDDVVEISCEVGQDGPTPLAVADPPDTSVTLMRSVKQYERLAVDAILNRSRSTAVEALMAHPLVLSYPRAHALVDEYLTAHAEHIGDWD